MNQDDRLLSQLRKRKNKDKSLNSRELSAEDLDNLMLSEEED